jgi:hypothetical protein
MDTNRSMSERSELLSGNIKSGRPISKYTMTSHGLIDSHLQCRLQYLRDTSLLNFRRKIVIHAEPREGLGGFYVHGYSIGL